MQFVTGYGAHDSHALTISATGATNTSPKAGANYDTVTLEYITNMVVNPQVCEKSQGQWVIPSEYNAHDARSHRVQKLKGKYWALVGDVDSGNPSLADVQDALNKVLGPNVWYAIYSTASATPHNMKWRFVVPLAHPLAGKGYSAFQAALFDAIELTMDRSLERTGQVFYLPIRGETYVYAFNSGGLLDLSTHTLRHAAQKIIKLDDREQVKSEQSADDMLGAYRYFRNLCTIQQMLAHYNFECDPKNDLLWRHPDQSNKGYGSVKVMEYADSDRWVSLSETVNATGMGKPTQGGRSGDAFDIYCHFEHGGNRRAAEVAVAAMRRQDPATVARVEEGHAAWGRIKATLEARAQELANQYHAALMENMTESAPLVDFERPDSNLDAVVAAHQYDIPWPSGLLGEIAKWIYHTNRYPIKQFAIVGAQYILTGIARKYHVDGLYPTMYTIVSAETGRGKGSMKARVDALINWLETEIHPGPHSPLERYNFEELASPQGLHAELAELEAAGGQPVICGYREELGRDMLNWAVGTGNDVAKMDIITRLFERAGKGRKLGARAYRDTKNKLNTVNEPCFSYIGDTQIEKHATLLGHPGLIDDGFMTRWSYVYFNGPRKVGDVVPEQVLKQRPPFLDKLVSVLQYGTDPTHAGAAVAVTVNSDVAPEQRKLEQEIADRVNDGDKTWELRNRESIIALRAAALEAVGINHLNPVVTKEIYQYWARFYGIGNIERLRMVQSGEIGAGERRRVSTALSYAAKYFTAKAEMRVRRGWCRNKTIAGSETTVPESYFTREMTRLEPFTGTNTGKTSEMLVRDTVQELVAQGYLIKMDGPPLGVVYRGSMQLYCIGEAMETYMKKQPKT